MSIVTNYSKISNRNPNFENISNSVSFIFTFNLTAINGSELLLTASPVPKEPES